MEGDGFLKTPFSLQGKSLWIAGHTGLVGSALCRKMESEGCTLLKVARPDLDLRDQSDVRGWMETHKPEIVIVAAAHVGGIFSNAREPAEYLYNNLMISTNIIHQAYKTGVEKLLFLGSSCIYPREAAQPIREESLLSGPFEKTNEAYAVAKIAGLKMCETYRIQYGCDFITAMPCNLYGPGDCFDEEKSHVIPALMMKAHKAKILNKSHLDVWGTGTEHREFLYVDDLAEALIFALQYYSSAKTLNIGAGEDIVIADLAEMICDVVGFNGEITFDLSKPGGTPRKLMDSSRIKKAGWKPKTDLRVGLKKTYRWYRDYCEDLCAA